MPNFYGILTSRVSNPPKHFDHRCEATHKSERRMVIDVDLSSMVDYWKTVKFQRDKR